LGTLLEPGVVSRLAPILALLALAACGDDSAPQAERPVPPPKGPPPVTLAAFPDGPQIGLSDNRPETLVDPRFKATGIKRVRKTVAFDEIETGGEPLKRLDLWFARAKKTGIEPLVSFYRSPKDKHLLPTVEEFRGHFRRFRERYPWVRLFSTWNEANFAAAQPTGRDPARTARFYRAAREECARECTVLTADFRADGGPESERWLKEFKRGLGPGPHIWGLVSYPDVNRMTDLRTRQFLRDTKGPVWVVEVGAIHFFGRGVPPSIARQTRVMRYLVDDYPRVSPRLERMYVYHWRAAATDRLFDSGLLSADGVPRPAYTVFTSAIRKPEVD
jgi:hypothetical protein